MKNKLKYNKRIYSKLILTEEEKEEIAKNVIEFMKSCLVVSDYVSNSEHYGNYKNYYYLFDRFKSGEGYYSRLKEKNNYEISDEELLNDFVSVGGMFDRFSYHIRMNGSIIHIKKLIELLGKDITISYFEYWSKKNMAVALLLNKFIEELK